MKHTEETKRKISLSRKGKGLGNKNAKEHSPWNKGLKGIHLSPNSEFQKGQIAPMKGRKMTKEHKENLSLSLKGRKVWNKGRKYIQISGEKNHNWKGGISKINKKERQLIMETLEYKLWRKAVFERDKWTCVLCGYRSCKKINGRSDIEADHIKRFSDFPELRFAIDNGRTLCVPCHKKTGTYGRGAIYRKQFVATA